MSEKIQIIRHHFEMLSISKNHQSLGKTIALVPTMGCLHEGHLSLIRAARRQADIVVVSIFVNPLQFGKNEDFGTYPRPFIKDCKFCETEEVDYIFYPQASDIYPADFHSKISGGPIAEMYCGVSRPGFFAGVLTIVSILFNIVKPNKAFFGEKDFQQLFLIQQMVRDLQVDIEIIPMPTIREIDGLAMSSRNKYLIGNQRQSAARLYEALKFIEKLVQKGDWDVLFLTTSARELIQKDRHITLDYLTIVNSKTLKELSIVDDSARILIAANLGERSTVRLIDNYSVELNQFY